MYRYSARYTLTWTACNRAVQSSHTSTYRYMRKHSVLLYMCPQDTGEAPSLCPALLKLLDLREGAER